MPGPRPGDRVSTWGGEPLGQIVDPNTPVPPGGALATMQILPELSDRRLFARHRKKPAPIVPTRMTRMWRTDVRADRSPVAWLDMRDSFAALCNDPEARQDLCRLAEWPGVGKEITYATIPRLARLLIHATVVVWQADRWDAALSGAKVFEETPLEPADWSGGPELWLLEQGPILEPPALGLDRPCQVVGILWVGTQRRTATDGISWFIFAAPQLPPEWWGTRAIESPEYLAKDAANWMPRIKALPGIAYGEPVMPYAAPLVAAGKFMRLPFIERRVAPVPRQQHRAYERRKPGHTSAVHTIVLRRTEYKYEQKGTGTVDWQWQWWTNGTWVHPKHERYKSSEPFYRKGCWKGPPDAPIKAPGEALYQVRK